MKYIQYITSTAAAQCSKSQISLVTWWEKRRDD